jgi:hypothetical protein
MTLEDITVKEHVLCMSCCVTELPCWVSKIHFCLSSLFCEQVCIVANLIVIVSRRLRIVLALIKSLFIAGVRLPARPPWETSIRGQHHAVLLPHQKRWRLSVSLIFVRLCLLANFLFQISLSNLFLCKQHVIGQTAYCWIGWLFSVDFL